MSSQSQVAARVRAAAEPAVAGSGLVVEDVQVGGGRRPVVRVVVDLADGPGGVDSDALGEAARAVSAALDAEDPVAGPYLLEVSTPGTDRPLTTPRHFRRAVTRIVRLTLTDGSTLVGRLVDADEQLTLVDAEGGTTAVDPADVVRGVVEVELARAQDEED